MANPFALSRWYHRLSNAFMPHLFRLFPVPRGFALLTTTGRRSGQPRSRPIRAVRNGDSLYAVAVLGERSDWLQNIRKEPRVTVRVATRTHTASARELSDPSECESAVAHYVDRLFPYDYTDYVALHWGFPTARKIREAHQKWVGEGVMVAIDSAAQERQALPFSRDRQ